MSIKIEVISYSDEYGFAKNEVVYTEICSEYEAQVFVREYDGYYMRLRCRIVCTHLD